MVFLLGLGLSASAQLYAPEIKIEDTNGKVAINTGIREQLLNVGGSIRIPVIEQNNTPDQAYGLVS